MKYEEAIQQLETIVSQIENNELDIDQLADCLKEAQKLIKLCKDKLYKTDEKIKALLDAEWGGETQKDFDRQEQPHNVQFIKILKEEILNISVPKIAIPLWTHIPTFAA